MKKVLNILIILSVILSIGLLYLGLQARVASLSLLVFQNKKEVLVKNKFLGMNLTTTEFLQQTEEIKKKAEKYRSPDKLTEITNVFNDFESHCFYEIDEVSVNNGSNKIIKGNGDTWLPAPLTLEMLKQTGEFHGDCEDGAIYLVALLNSLGIKAYVNIGTLSLNNNIYGHSWVTVYYNGLPYPMETTQGRPITELITMQELERMAEAKGYMVRYKINFRFSLEGTEVFTGTNINEQPVYPPLPPAKIPELREILNN